MPAVKVALIILALPLIWAAIMSSRKAKNWLDKAVLWAPLAGAFVFLVKGLPFIGLICLALALPLWSAVNRAKNPRALVKRPK